MTKSLCADSFKRMLFKEWKESIEAERSSSALRMKDLKN
jgi:hypothetical protein